ncbi:hypothetical protein BFV94_0728 [Alteromonas macleodii]|uniref:Uncharacterized protein n=1 Tax=Alteromonas macleodii TaxID=28108 RepID=A0AB36G1T5_ALTMA|nr:hypothetical protein BFV95_0726 [Alteromonas macleodii]OES35485.1 hypothetical protein BFV94_0728 [Alteromonas macleodii]OES36950.1 hypothetical protein BFV93_0727 [Alteromonas macleodii]OES42558.1 hypothetical protein BFV96_0727 [Alteromonas macleodii]
MNCKAKLYEKTLENMRTNHTAENKKTHKACVFIIFKVKD